MLELPINDEDFNLLHNTKHFSSGGSPSSAWSKSLANGTPGFHYHNQQSHLNHLYHNNNISLNPHFLQINDDYRNVNGNRHNNNYIHHAPQFVYGTTTTTSSHGIGGNGSGIPTSSGMITGRGAAAKATAVASNRVSNQFRNIPSTREEDSSGEFSVDEESVSQHNNVNVNKTAHQNSK